jgi:hypothetical protein
MQTVSVNSNDWKQPQPEFPIIGSRVFDAGVICEPALAGEKMGEAPALAGFFSRPAGRVVVIMRCVKS